MVTRCQGASQGAFQGVNDFEDRLFAARRDERFASTGQPVTERQAQERERLDLSPAIMPDAGHPGLSPSLASPWTTRFQ